jgi:hypothetical protein
MVLETVKCSLKTQSAGELTAVLEAALRYVPRCRGAWLQHATLQRIFTRSVLLLNIERLVTVWDQASAGAGYLSHCLASIVFKGNGLWRQFNSLLVEPFLYLKSTYSYQCSQAWVLPTDLVAELGWTSGDGLPGPAVIL